MSKFEGPGAFLRQHILQTYGQKALQEHDMNNQRLSLYSETMRDLANDPVALSMNSPEFEFTDLQ